MGSRITSAQLFSSGFVNKVFPQSTDAVFLASVIAHLQDKFADLDKESVVITKRLIQESLTPFDSANAREMFEGAARFHTGKPQVQFARIAAKTKKHKL